jgi:ATP-dependent DNA helicase RecG
MSQKKNKEILPLQYFKGVGPKKAEALAAIGIIEAADLLWYFPRAYIDRNSDTSLLKLSEDFQEESMFQSNIKSKDIKLRGEATLLVKIKNIRENTTGKNRKMLLFDITDKSGASGTIIFWNRHQYFSKAYNINDNIIINGNPETDPRGRIQFTHPEIEKFNPAEHEEFSLGGIVPVYRMTQDLKNAYWNLNLLRRIIQSVLDKELSNVQEFLPDELLKKYKLPDIQTTIRQLHFPENIKQIERSRKRIKFQEIFLFEILLALRQRGIKIAERGIAMNPKSQLARRLYDKLPFQLTGDQKKVIREIAEDLESGKPMNRLLQGDVGSGKTIVALLCMLIAIDNGYQTAIMAPTEILAEQHYHSISKMLEFLDIKVIQLLGGQRAKVRRDVLEKISTGYANIIVGTHALFQSEIEYKNLGLFIIDEQHRFGVAQRAELRKLAKASFSEENAAAPHILVMSATPIPRTLSMTVYGDLDVSVIREMPRNRKPIKTKVVFESQTEQVYEFIRAELKKGHQAYIVYPLVEESEKLLLKAATVHYERIKSEVFPEFKCGLLHGQMFWYEKEETMRSFLNKEFQILIATTVIEVGIDIPNATIMLIEDSDRFGLSQLHQLRGRVGRSELQSYCMLVAKDKYRFELNKKYKSDDERKAVIIRLKTMEETTDGFEIAEIDMKLRGPGDLLGTRQSGLPAFKFLDLAEDQKIISIARKDAFEIISNDPHLRLPEHELLKQEFLRLYREENIFIDIA